MQTDKQTDRQIDRQTKTETETDREGGGGVREGDFIEIETLYIVRKQTSKQTKRHITSRLLTKIRINHSLLKSQGMIA